MILRHTTGIIYTIWVILRICDQNGKKSFLEIVDKHAPLRKARVRGRGSPWIPSELKKQMHERDILKIKLLSLCRALWRIFWAKEENLAG